VCIMFLNDFFVKENLGEKPQNAPSEPSLTESRGLLSSVQSKATITVFPEPPTVIAVSLCQC
jgi:hypothetical protein